MKTKTATNVCGIEIAMGFSLVVKLGAGERHAEPAIICLRSSMAEQPIIGKDGGSVPPVGTMAALCYAVDLFSGR